MEKMYQLGRDGNTRPIREVCSSRWRQYSSDMRDQITIRRAVKNADTDQGISTLASGKHQGVESGNGIATRIKEGTVQWFIG